MKAITPGLSALALALIATSLPMPAAARGFSRGVSIQGSNGHGLTSNRTVNRQPGAVSAQRSVQGNNGRGYTSDRNRTCAPGSCTSERSIQTNGGQGATTTGSAQWGDGQYQRNKTTTTNDGRTLISSSAVTGPNGESHTVSVPVTPQP